MGIMHGYDTTMTAYYYYEHACGIAHARTQLYIVSVDGHAPYACSNDILVPKLPDNCTVLSVNRNHS